MPHVPTPALEGGFSGEGERIPQFSQMASLPDGCYPRGTQAVAEVPTPSRLLPIFCKLTAGGGAGWGGAEQGVCATLHCLAG